MCFWCCFGLTGLSPQIWFSLLPYFRSFLRVHENSLRKIFYYPLELYLLIKDTMYSLTKPLFTRLIIAVAGDL